MHAHCPYCSKHNEYVYDSRTIRSHGRYYRTSDSKSVERFKCLTCLKTFSRATSDPNYWQKKRQKNRSIFELKASGVSGRRIARLLRINRKTVARRLIAIGKRCLNQLEFDTAALHVSSMQFDDLETFEHSKMKPVSVTLAVDARTRRILGFRVAEMSAKGLLAKKSIKKYGLRRDERSKMRRDLFRELRPVVQPGATIASDSNPYYVNDVKEFFPSATHIQVDGKRGAVTGQGELKKVVFDPIFSLNHTCAMLRANISRLIRKTWCTTKRKERLADHLAIYAAYHNMHL